MPSQNKGVGWRTGSSNPTFIAKAHGIMKLNIVKKLSRSNLVSESIIVTLRGSLDV
jgi:hypothetical protein